MLSLGFVMERRDRPFNHYFTWRSRFVERWSTQGSALGTDLTYVNETNSNAHQIQHERCHESSDTTDKWVDWSETTTLQSWVKFRLPHYHYLPCSRDRELSDHTEYCHCHRCTCQKITQYAKLCTTRALTSVIELPDLVIIIKWGHITRLKSMGCRCRIIF